MTNRQIYEKVSEIDARLREVEQKVTEISAILETRLMSSVSIRLFRAFLPVCTFLFLLVFSFLFYLASSIQN